LLHHIEDVEDMAASEWVGGRRAGIRWHQVGLLGTRYAERRQIAVASSPAASPAAGPAARGVVISGGRFSDRHGLRGFHRGGGFGRGLRCGHGAPRPDVVFPATAPATPAPAAAAFGFPALLGVFAGSRGGGPVIVIGVGDIVVFVSIGRLVHRRKPVA
jgi:hypothetical protein